MISVIYKTKDFVIIDKAPNTPSQSDKSGDVDAMTELSVILSEEENRGEVYLVHRLDRVVGGLLVFARNRNSAGVLSGLVSSGDFIKEYYAIVEGEAPGGIMRDFLFKDSLVGKAFVVDKMRKGVKEAQLEYKTLDTAVLDGVTYSLVKVKLATGRFHQIRVQFASRGMSLMGDGKYGSRNSSTRFPALFSTRLSFNYKGKTVDVSKLPPINEHPWSLFGEGKYI